MGVPAAIPSRSSATQLNLNLNLPDDPPTDASVHSLHSFDDHEPVDNPPPYTAEDADSHFLQQSAFIIGGGYQAAIQAEQSSPSPSSFVVPSGRTLTSSRLAQSYMITLAPALSRNPELLCELIQNQSLIAPVPCIQISGSHTEPKRGGNNNSSNGKETVKDFDFGIDTTGLVLPKAVFGRGSEWESSFYTVNVVGDYDEEIRTYRGGRFKSKGQQQGRLRVSDPEYPGQNYEESTTLEEWCRRFCADKAGVKS